MLLSIRNQGHTDLFSSSIEILQLSDDHEFRNPEFIDS